MLFPEGHAPMLKAWIVKRLENTSDAEPDVLADYVLALLRHPGTAADVRKLCEEEIPDFLKEDSTVFVNDVFEAINYKSYLPGAPPLPKHTGSQPATAPPASQAGGVPYDDPFTVQSPRFSKQRNGSRKRSYVDLDDPSGQNGASRFARGGRAFKQARRGGGFGGRNGGVEEASGLHSAPSDRLDANATHNPNLPQLSNGFGAGLPFAIPELELPTNTTPGFGANGQSGTMKRCRDYDTKGFCARGSACPFDHGDILAFPRNFNMFSSLPAPTSSRFATMPQPGEEYNPHDPAAFLLPQLDGQNMRSFPFPGLFGGGLDAPRGGRQAKSPARRWKRSTFSADGPVTDRTKSTIVVENIPEENFDEDQVRAFFGQFGNVVEVSMQPYKRLAIVKFDSWASANAAWKSPKVVFDNRFVKVFWYRDDQSSLPPSKPLNGDFRNGQRGQTSETLPDAPSSTEPVIDMEEFQRKQEDAQRIHEEKQKQLLEIERQREELAKKEKEILERQREEKAKLFAKITALSQKGVKLEDGEDSAKGTKTSQSEALRAQLAALEAEAMFLGLDPDTQSVMDEPMSWNPRGGRGRGRGGFFRSRGFALRGRGGYRPGSNNAVYAAYSLDNRPKKVKVAGVDLTTPDKDELLRQYLFGVGEFTDIQTTPSSAEITFKDRKTAEKFFSGVQAEGIPGIDGPIELTWVGGSASGTPTPVSTPARFFKPEVAAKPPVRERQEPEAPAMEEGEVDEGEETHDDDKDVDIVLERPPDQVDLDYEVAEDW